MNIRLLAFTDRGHSLAQRLAGELGGPLRRLSGPGGLDRLRLEDVRSAGICGGGGNRRAGHRPPCAP